MKDLTNKETRMKRGKFLIGALSAFVFLSTITIFARAPLTFEERVKAQEAIEKVYYNHRIWPKENPQPKPPFEKMIPKKAIEAKVTYYLKKSSALEKFWYRPIEAKQLQAEMDRMAKGSKDPQTLNELFAALNNDPYLIAECLARPILADRLVHNWYANDERFHKETREKAEEALKHLTPENFCSYPEGQYNKMTYRLEVKGREEMEMPDPVDRSAALAEKEFARLLAEIPEEGKISGIIEKDDCFVIIHAIEKNEGEMMVESVSFKKVFAEEWLKGQKKERIPPETTDNIAMSLPPVKESGCTEGWDNGILDDVPEPRCEHTAIWTGTEMIIWGGWIGCYQHYFKKGYRYNPSTDTWCLLPAGVNSHHECHGHAAVWTGTEMIVWGGEYFDGNSWKYLNCGARYNPITDMWLSTSIGANVPSERTAHSAIWTGKEMVIWGGIGNSSFWLNTGSKYDPTTDIWEPTSTGINCPAGRIGHTAVWTGSEMIIWGGRTSDLSSSNTNSGARYNPTTDGWMAISTGINCPTGRSEHTAIWTGSEMIIWGGGDAQGARYNPSSDTWVPTATGQDCPNARSEHTAVWTGSEMIIWGGASGSDYCNSGGIYNPSSNSWRTISTGANVPSKRCHHSAVWTGTEMIVWGGEESDCYGEVATGGRYSPSTDSWVATSNGFNCPSGRSSHTAVWSGSEMIIWGGSNWNSGGRYFPATDSWLQTSTGTNCPKSRYFHTAVWNGSVMIVWGGKNYLGGYLDDGGKYDPTTDTWMAITKINAPTAREFHSAVWTGTDMIIWGGSNSSSCFNSGGKYNPIMDSWSSTSMGEGVLSPRLKHSSIWTGNEMVIWGGWNDDVLNSGGKYNPLQDTWKQMTMKNAPSVRDSHSAVWTGSEMIVWGGTDGNQLNSGGKYDPTTDNWKSIADGTNCPQARYGHVAVWTGRTMIVWGGENDILLNSGGKYDPTANEWTSTVEGSFVPSARFLATAIWTGKSLIIWGGSGYQSGGIYFPSPCGESPSITGISAVSNPFRLKISGSGFQQGAAVKVEGVAVPQTVFKSDALLVAKKGASLSQMVPKGTTVVITVVNPDGVVSGEFPYTR
jgi:N-acetylneuraminic acid mutarotase